MFVKAKDLKAGMIIELEMMASYHARKNKVTKVVEIEEDVFYSEGDKEVMVDFIDCNTKKGGVIMLPPFQEYKLIQGEA
ncbi:hypothetical protein D0S48_13635 [Psychrobacillus sp. AK 1817]|uniref:hypothetical protein n=1 Tax=Psychrobacillus sp. AK 1817 TaxID=2303505 RepID=UPI0012473121|nr:hypothetical protein [Psychrobacillus sp. AK 1817]QEY21624.1 hypothetical protein D0S48_13635 [Psychrobacillus sp. AK 1817]